MKILVSSCLIGKECAYDGKCRLDPAVSGICRKLPYIDLCPETAGGLLCPREKHEIINGTGEDVLSGTSRVLDRTGRDRTSHFIRGAFAALEKSRAAEVSFAVLRSRSPSCGSSNIHSGQFNGSLRKGPGVTAALLKLHGIRVVNEMRAAELFMESPGPDKGFENTRRHTGH